MTSRGIGAQFQAGLWVSLTGLRDAQIAVKHFWGVSGRVFLEEISFESVDWVKQVFRSNVHYPVY